MRMSSYRYRGEPSGKIDDVHVCFYDKNTGPLHFLPFSIGGRRGQVFFIDKSTDVIVIYISHIHPLRISGEWMELVMEITHSFHFTDCLELMFNYASISSDATPPFKTTRSVRVNILLSFTPPLSLSLYTPLIRERLWRTLNLNGETSPPQPLSSHFSLSLSVFGLLYMLSCISFAPHLLSSSLSLSLSL